MNSILKEVRVKSIKDSYFDVMKSLQKSSLYVSTEDIVQELMKRSAPRFFIDYENARRVISLMHRGKPVSMPNENKMNMYKEIYKRFLELTQNSNAPGYYLLEYVLEQPAPSYYVNIGTMRAIVYKSIKSR